MVRRFLGLLVALTVLFVFADARAGKVGSDFLVSGNANAPSVARLSNGGFVVVWRAGKSKFTISGLRYSSKGKTVGGVFKVSSSASIDSTVKVAAFSTGDFVVVWSASDGDGLGIFGQRYSKNGQKLGKRFRVNNATAFDQHQASVAVLKNDGFVVVWTREGSANHIAAQRYSSKGKPRGGEIDVATSYPTIAQFPNVAALTGGGFVISWQGYVNTEGQLFSRTAAKVGGEFQINAVTQSAPSDAALAGLTNGGFVAVLNVTNGGDNDIEAVRFDANAMKIGKQVRANTIRSGLLGSPAVTGVNNGGFAVVWDGGTSPGSVKGQVFKASGKKSGKEFLVNSTKNGAGPYPLPAVASQGTKGFVAVWHAEKNNGVYGQRFD